MRSRFEHAGKNRFSVVGDLGEKEKKKRLLGWSGLLPPEFSADWNLDS